jgi:hypothetical protein
MDSYWEGALPMLPELVDGSLPIADPTYAVKSSSFEMECNLQANSLLSTCLLRFR